MAMADISLLEGLHIANTCFRAIWRGYKEIKDAGGWASLVFSGAGIYRFCKYGVSLLKDAAPKLQQLRRSFEVAADTLHPGWRQLLIMIGQATPRAYDGHPHDWVIASNGHPVSLASTYAQWDSNFEYRHLKECQIDAEAWGTTRDDPRRLHGYPQSVLYCSVCSRRQADDVRLNQCKCFPEVYGDARASAPVQLFQTTNGRNNGVIARCVCRYNSLIFLNFSADLGVPVIRARHRRRRVRRRDHARRPGH